MTQAELPLEGILVLDVSRMLPGAVLARQLLDLGARLIKIEEPGIGDPMRMVPPLVGGVGIGFATFLRGAESVCLDLNAEKDRQRLRALITAADVLVESFRPGTLEGWGLGYDDVASTNPRLVWCSMSSFGRAEAVRHRVAHDLNLTSLSGALAAMNGDGLPRIQLADIGAGMLAGSSILAALLHRERTGCGACLDQPLATGPLPFMTWRWAEAALGRDEVVDMLLGGACPCYRTYDCGADGAIAVAALEPKFWIGFVAMLGLDEFAESAFATGDAGAEVVTRIEKRLAERLREHWLELAEDQGLPVSAVHEPHEARLDPVFKDAGLVEETQLPGGKTLAGVGPWHGSLGRTPDRPAPKLGEHTEVVFAELGGCTA